MKKPIRRVRSGPVVAVGVVVALLAASGGTAFAAAKVTSKNIKNNTIKSVDVKNGTLTGKDVKNSSLTGKDVKNSSLTGSDVKNESLTGSDVKNGSLTASDVAAGTFAPASALGGTTLQVISKRIPLSTSVATIATYLDVEVRAGCTAGGDVVLSARKKAGGASYAYGLTRVDLNADTIDAFDTGNLGTISLLPVAGTDAQTTATFTSSSGQVVNLSLLARGSSNFNPAVDECVVAGTVIVG
jgi:hypothetical protein